MQLGPVCATQLVGAYPHLMWVWGWGLEGEDEDQLFFKIKKSDDIYEIICVSQLASPLKTNLWVNRCSTGQRADWSPERNMKSWHQYEYLVSSLNGVNFLLLGFMLCLHSEIAGDEAIWNKNWTEDSDAMIPIIPQPSTDPVLHRKNRNWRPRNYVDELQHWNYKIGPHFQLFDGTNMSNDCEEEYNKSHCSHFVVVFLEYLEEEERISSEFALF